MRPNKALDHLVEKAGRHWELRRRAAAAEEQAATQPPPAFSITLSRAAGTQGTAIAQEVGQRLGWHVYDHELLERIARDKGLRTGLLESVDERRIGVLRECMREVMEGIAGVSYVSEDTYAHELIETVLALGSHGECVIVGRGAAHILPEATTLRVRVFAPLPARVTALARRLSIPEREAARKVREIDHERTDFIEDHFGKDARDPQNYDLLLNTARFSVPACAELIIESLRRLQALAAGQHP